MVIQRHALEPQAQRLPVNGENGFQGHKRDAQQQRALHAYLQEHAPQVRALQGKPQVNIDPAALQGLITGSAAGQGLNIERLDNQGDGGLQVSLQPTDFARLLRWLISLEEQGVRVEEAGLERAEKGLVSTRLLLRAG